MSDVLSEGAYLDGHVVADRGAFTLDAEVCARARSLMVCAPFLLHEKIRAALLKDRAEAGPAGLRFLLLDRPGNLGDAEGVDLLDARGGVDVSVATALKTPLHDYQRRQLAGRESFHHAGVHLHAKLILADPLGPDPTVITGSANYSENSTTDNDENTLVFRGDAAVADIYATEFMRVFDAYHFRGRKAQREAAGRALQLATDDRWSERYYAPPGPDGDRAAARRLFAGTADEA
jgi:phosphatidylserine/phosphatidylglycerophosphate/cardiolipin synthase-like enzyme